MSLRYEVRGICVELSFSGIGMVMDMAWNDGVGVGVGVVRHQIPI